MSKRCIFHTPSFIDPEGKSGSQVRPMKIVNALNNIGYEVDVVWGNSSERKQAISKIKQNIINGIKYDFLYSESSTTPTLLTDSDHFPRHPFIDFGFMKFCRKNNVKVGLYYRDMYWKFPFYKKLLPWYKRMIIMPMFKYDLKMYNKHLDIFYVPSESIKLYLNSEIKKKINVLPPGADFHTDIIIQRKEYFNQRSGGRLKLFYVGGFGGPGSLYDCGKIITAIQHNENIEFTLCCHQSEWEESKYIFEPYLSERINIVHKSGEDLEQYYNDCDICMCFFQGFKYRNMSMPVKLLEYTGHVTPVITWSGGEAAKFVDENNIGWSIDYDEDTLSNLLNEIIANPEELHDKHINAIKCLEKNTWDERAKQIAAELS